MIPLQQQSNFEQYLCEALTYATVKKRLALTKHLTL